MDELQFQLSTVRVVATWLPSFEACPPRSCETVYGAAQ
jgi:hypothetical protein